MSTQRGYVIQVRVTKTEQNQIKREARETDVSVAELLRRKLLSPDITPVRGDSGGSKTKREA